MYFLGGWVGVEKNNPITYNFAKWYNQIVQIMKKINKIMFHFPSLLKLFNLVIQLLSIDVVDNIPKIMKLNIV